MNEWMASYYYGTIYIPFIIKSKNRSLTMSFTEEKENENEIKYRSRMEEYMSLLNGQIFDKYAANANVVTTMCAIH